MKKVVFQVVGIILLAGPATAHPISLKCTNERGLTMEIHVNPVETTVPYFDVVIAAQGKVIEEFEAVLKQDSNGLFRAESQEKNGWINYVGYDANSKVGYLKKAANGGLSPVPGSFFKNCIVK
jgi:hypothetical protein